MGGVLLFVNTRVNHIDFSRLNMYHNHLSMAEFENLITNRYDVDWMTTVGISQEALTAFVSKDKLDALVIAGAIKVGDEIYFTSPSDGTEKSAIITQINGTVESGNSKGRKLPHLDIFKDRDPTEVGPIANYTGPTNIVTAFNILEPVGEIKGKMKG